MANRTVVIIDTIRPVLTLFGDVNMDWQGGDTWVDPGCRASDLLDGDITSRIVITGTVDYLAPAGSSFRLYYNVVDAAGNAALTLSRNVTIIDTIAPEITLFGSTNMTHEAAIPWTDPGYYAYDHLDGNITRSVQITGSIDILALSGTEFTLLYNVQDRAGNHAEQKQRLVIVIDTIRPVITLLGDVVVYHQGATPWVDPGFTAWDEGMRNHNITADVFVNGTVDVDAAAGSRFVLTYTVSDITGNEALPLQRTVIIIDTIRPVLTLTGDVTAGVDAIAKTSDGRRWRLDDEQAAECVQQMDAGETVDTRGWKRLPPEDAVIEEVKAHGPEVVEADMAQGDSVGGLRCVYFASGSNHQGEIEGLSSVGFNVGVAAPEVKSAETIGTLTGLAGTGIRVFVDSGAFGEVDFNFPNATPRPKKKIQRPPLVANILLPLSVGFRKSSERSFRTIALTLCGLSPRNIWSIKRCKYVCSNTFYL
jgi:hypothetical protein